MRWWARPDYRCKIQSVGGIEVRPSRLATLVAFTVLAIVAAQGCGGESGPSGSSAASGGTSGTGASGAGGASATSGRGGAGGVGGSTAGVSGSSGGTAGSSAGSAGRSGSGSSGASGASGAAGVSGRGGTGGQGGGSGSVGEGGAAALGGGGEGGATPCGTDCEARGFDCCNGRCVNLGNDPTNCGSCGTLCSPFEHVCDHGTCVPGVCDTPDVCPMTAAPLPPKCCGAECCLTPFLCCIVPGPIGEQVGCFDPSDTEGTCPRGCLDCDCAAPDTPIATPGGDRAIAELLPGDLVYSVDHGAVVVVPIRAVHRRPVTGVHRVPRVTLANGAVLEISGAHPTGDDRIFADLRAGDDLGGVRVIRVEPGAPYHHAFTHDILPDSSTGAYFAAGALVGSTLADGAMTKLR